METGDTGLKEHWNACEGDMISIIEPVWENNQLKRDISVGPCQRDRRQEQKKPCLSRHLRMKDWKTLVT